MGRSALLRRFGLARIFLMVGLASTTSPAWAQGEDDEADETGSSTALTNSEEPLSPPEADPAPPMGSPEDPDTTLAVKDQAAHKPSGGQPNDSNEKDGRGIRFFREMEAPNGTVFAEPQQWLEWHGNLQLDGAYANYSFLAGNIEPYQEVYDLRGRFVMGPTFTHEFGKNFFLQARGEIVAWVREQQNVYQINVDDVYARFGQKGLWDLSVGRFFSWRVYHRGRGFDLFTVEDLGACMSGDCAGQNPNNFAPRMYEVSHIYMRGTPGRAAVHIYPTEWSGIELLAEYGSTSTSKFLGGRAAGTIFHKYFRLSGAAEYSNSSPTKTPTDPITGMQVNCPTCGETNRYGFGGGAEVTLKPLEAGFNIAQGYTETFSAVNGTSNGTSSILSMGGYVEFDPGYFFNTSVILGGGLNWTQQNAPSGDYDSHEQIALYAAYPIRQIQGAEIKLVASRANLLHVVGSTAGENYTDSNALRLRFWYQF